MVISAQPAIDYLIFHLDLWGSTYGQKKILRQVKSLDGDYVQGFHNLFLKSAVFTVCMIFGPSGHRRACCGWPLHPWQWVWQEGWRVGQVATVLLINPRHPSDVADLANRKNCRVFYTISFSFYQLCQELLCLYCSITYIHTQQATFLNFSNYSDSKVLKRPQIS